MLSVKTLISQGQVHTRGAAVGHISDVVIHHGNGRVMAYLLDPGDGAPLQAVLFDALMYHQGNTAMVQSLDDVVPLSKLPRLQSIAQQGQLLGTPWLDFQGSEIGTIEDITFDGTSGHVMYYRIKYHAHVPVNTPMVSAALSPFRGQ